MAERGVMIRDRGKLVRGVPPVVADKLDRMCVVLRLAEVRPKAIANHRANLRTTPEPLK